MLYPITHEIVWGCVFILFSLLSFWACGEKETNDNNDIDGDSFLSTDGDCDDNNPLY